MLARNNGFAKKQNSLSVGGGSRRYTGGVELGLLVRLSSLDHGLQLLIASATQQLARLFDFVDSEKQRSRMEHWIIWLAAGGFVTHLILIALARFIPALKAGVLSRLDVNFLHAVYTPFTFILFFEVILLVLALPRSHTISIGKQYEIISLIVIRRVFKDIGEFNDPAQWLARTDLASMVLLDMVAALLMFALVALFQRVSHTVIRSKPDSDLATFLAIKKTVAVLLFSVLLLLAIYNVTQWAFETWAISSGRIDSAKNLDFFFFPSFFEFMIFTDVFLLIASIPFYDRYEYVIRNSGFVISTVLLRFALSTPKPYDLAISLVAMVYGLCVLGVFSYYTRAIVPKSEGGSSG
jgi:hypothetical protein